LRKRVNVARSQFPSITHVDYSARIQTVDEERHGRYYRLMKAFEKRTGLPVIVNTSFNVRGEPIVNTRQRRSLLRLDRDGRAGCSRTAWRFKEGQPPELTAGSNRDKYLPISARLTMKLFHEINRTRRGARCCSFRPVPRRFRWLGALQYFRWGHPDKALVIWSVARLALLAQVPGCGRYVYLGWMGLGVLIGLFVQPIVMMVAFALSSCRSG